MNPKAASDSSAHGRSVVGIVQRLFLAREIMIYKLRSGQAGIAAAGERRFRR
jgi:hypothetical protein